MVISLHDRVKISALQGRVTYICARTIHIQACRLFWRKKMNQWMHVVNQSLSKTFSLIQITIRQLIYKKINLEILSAKRRPFSVLQRVDGIPFLLGVKDRTPVISHHYLSQGLTLFAKRNISVIYTSGIFNLFMLHYYSEASQIGHNIKPTSISNRSDTFVSNRCVFNVNSKICCVG